MKLNDPGLDRTDGIDRKIEAMGKLRWMNVQITWLHNPITGERDEAEINATDQAGRQIKDSVEVSSVDGCWYVDLGERTPRPNDPLPAST